MRALYAVPLEPNTNRAHAAGVRGGGGGGSGGGGGGGDGGGEGAGARERAPAAGAADPLSRTAARRKGENKARGANHNRRSRAAGKLSRGLGAV